MDGWKYGRTDGKTDGTDENFIPLRHTSYAGYIINKAYNEAQMRTQQKQGVEKFGNPGLSNTTTRILDQKKKKKKKKREREREITLVEPHKPRNRHNKRAMMAL